MKNLLFCLVFLFSYGFSEAQVFAPDGAMWVHERRFRGKVISKVERDTIIDGQTCKYISRSSSFCCELADYVYVQDSVVYIYNEESKKANKFDTLYNFGGEVGDSWTFSSDLFSTGKVILSIVEKVTLSVDGVDFPGIVLDRTILNQDSSLYLKDLLDTVYVQLGGNNYWLDPLANFFLCEYCFGVRTCYRDSSSNVFNIDGDTECDFTISLESLEHVPNFSIFPNPVNNELHYQDLNLPNPEETLLQLYDLQGSKIAETKAQGESGIWELQQLPAGVYFLLIQTPTTRYFGSKLVKQ